MDVNTQASTPCSRIIARTRKAGIIFIRRKGELFFPLVKMVLLWTIHQTLLYIKLAVKDEVATFLTTLRQSKIPAFRMG